MNTASLPGRNGKCGERGSLTLSYVIIFPLILFALMVITQASLWYLAGQAAIAAARQGVEAARVQHAPPGAGTAAALAFASTVASGYLRNPAVTTGTSNQTVQVTVTGAVPSLVPGLVIRVSEAAQGPTERFTVP